MSLCKVVTVGPDMDPGVIAIASERGQGGPQVDNAVSVWVGSGKPARLQLQHVVRIFARGLQTMEGSFE